MKLLLSVFALTALAAAQTPDAGAIRDQLDRYLLEYEPQLSTLVADERMKQRDGAAVTANRQTAAPTTDREIVSEVAFVGLPGGVGWMGFRHVIAVNGRKVGESRALGALLADPATGAFEQARKLLAESASHNLGLPRTTNLPNLPLELLHPRNRSRLRHRVDGKEKIRGVETARMVFEETARPTIIRKPDGGDTQTMVVAWVEPSTGRLLRAQVKTRDPQVGVLPFDATVVVEFRPDEKLGLLVPYEMKEEFFAGRFREGTGTARYTNYRQFKTAARIVQ